jgi:hypothetical protein
MMKLELLLFLMIAAGAVGTACGASGGPDLPTGAGGSGSTAVATATSSAQSGPSTGTGATSGSGTGVGSTGVGGGGGASSCAAAATCGNFGDGCIKCAAKTACAAEYTACFDDAQCKAYSACIEPCGVKQLDCLQLCQNQYPVGATEYQALTRCVICGDCVTLCDHAPDTCK